LFGYLLNESAGNILLVTARVAIAKRAEHTAYDVRYNCRNLTVWLHLYSNAELTLTFFTAHAGGVHYLPDYRWFVFFDVFCGPKSNRNRSKIGITIS